jgi:hypothetical protein
VRELGVALGLPPEMVYRHPFPGPGLGVRILGEVKKEYAEPAAPRRRDLHRGAAQLPRREVGKTWYDLTSQAFTVFLPVKSVGVMGDGRTYDYVVALRAVQTSDFMTADWAELPYALLKKVSSRIINEVRGINRVTYDVSSKPPRRSSGRSDGGVRVSVVMVEDNPLHLQRYRENLALDASLVLLGEFGTAREVKDAWPAWRPTSPWSISGCRTAAAST